MNIEIDNFNLIGKLLFNGHNPLNDGEFYLVQIFVRGKDKNHIQGNSKNRLVKFYTICSYESFLKFENEIKEICNSVNGRAYINLTRRNDENVAKIALKLMSDLFISENWKATKTIYSSACGQSYVASDKKFVVDLDGLCPDDEKYCEIKEYIKTIKGKNVDGERIFAEIPTLNGYHLITYPFDVQSFKKKYSDIDIHKNNPTLLYYKRNNDE